MHAKIWGPPEESGMEAMLGAFRKGLGENDEFKWDESNNIPGVEIPGLEPEP